MIVTEKKLEKNIEEILQKNYLFDKSIKSTEKNTLMSKILKSNIFTLVYFKILLFVNICSNTILLRINKNLTIKKIHKLLN
jgi:hypothetical protein